MKTMNYLALVAALSLAAPSHAGERSGGWTTSWYASPHATWSADFPLPTAVPATLARQTVRETARISVGGTRVRIVLSNRYGDRAIVIGDARVARAGDAAGSARELTFGGKRAATIPAGAPLVSDPVDMRVGALEKLAVSVYLPQATPLKTFHWGAQQTGHIANGNATGAKTLKDAQAMHGRALLSAILVEAPGG